jgi:hypothetical protein
METIGPSYTVSEIQTRRVNTSKKEELIEYNHMCQAIGSFCGSTCCSLDLGRIQMKR